MLRLKKVSCVHDIREGKDDLPLTISATFIGMTAWGSSSLRVMLSPDDEQQLAWTTLENHLRRSVIDSMKSQCYHDVEEFYKDDPTEGCTCTDSPAHLKDCPLYQVPK